MRPEQLSVYHQIVRRAGVRDCFPKAGGLGWDATPTTHEPCTPCKLFPGILINAMGIKVPTSQGFYKNKC